MKPTEERSQDQQSVELPNRNVGANANGPTLAASEQETASHPRDSVENENKDVELGENGKRKTFQAVDPSKLLDPIRTDPVKALELRKRRLDRQADSFMPEIHFVGEITSGKDIAIDSTEGVFCR